MRLTTRTATQVPRSRVAATAATALLVLAVAGCGGQDQERPESADSPTPLETSLSPLTTSSPSSAASAMPPASTAPPSATASSSGTASSSTELTASVGTPDDPDAYVISLVDADGEEVTELPAGDYTIAVDDRSTIHNVHLTGEGVEETTTVPEVVMTTWEVTLEPGDYTYRCDPHPNMVGNFTVT
ncbi:hypothetical protein WDZ17_11665 [Pseudokineococcus basanitobsidens]|uniref:Copper binding plastocyanin/azurin family protein n=1 Tax=Pseudokineococcus basanitobsidens TaxID=1926649 RepID=A0ABU8RLJ3_9ACTN